jgi:hypothetical protein
MGLYLLLAIVLGVIAGISSYSSEEKWLSLIVGGAVCIVFGGLNYFLMPTLNLWGFDGIWIELTLASVIGFFICPEIDSRKELLGRLIPLVICLLMLVIRIGSSAAMFHSKEYSELLKPFEVTDSAFASSVHPIPVEKMISVKKEYAEDLASKRIENMPSLGSRCRFGDADMININGSFAIKTAEGNNVTLNFENEKVWVMPLEHRGLWKWANNKVTDGYAIVSAHDPNRIFFVTEVNGKPLKLKYLKSACFGDDICCSFSIQLHNKCGE